MSNWYNVFSWFKGAAEVTNPTKRARRAPAPRDWTDSLQVNSELTKGLYHNSYPGLKLAGSLAYNPIAVPVAFMGLPIPVVDNDDRAEEELKTILEAMTDKIKQIHIQCHREGTIWIWPKFNTKKGLIWEFIPDDVVSDIIRDLNTGDIIRIQTDENITLSIGDGNVATVRRTRVFSALRVDTRFTGDVPEGVRDKVSRNPAGILPIPFSNNADGDETRGHSDYERIITDLKNYHDVDLAESNILAKFTPKMVVNHITDIEDYAKNQGYSDSTDMFENIELGSIDIVLNTKEEEVLFEFPERATESYTKKLQQIFHKIIEASGIPEIAWGLKTEGNLASVEENMSILMNYVKDKQDQKVQDYKLLFTVSLSLLSTAQVLQVVPDLSIAWNRLDSVSDKTKAEIFKNFATGLASIIKVAGLTEEQLYTLWKLNFPQVTEETLDEFKDGLIAMSAHTVRTNSSLDDVLLSNGA